MNQMYRKGLDMGVAFSSTAKNINPSSPKKIAGVQHATSSSQRQINLLKKTIVWILRPMMKMSYRLFKPIARPFVSRLKQYFIGDLRQEMQNFIGGLRQEMQNFIGDLRQEIQNFIGDLRQEIQLHNANVTRSLERIEQYSHAVARRIVVHCNEQEVLVKTDIGFIFCPATDYPLLACLIDTGDLEQGTRLLIERFLRPGDVFIDVGANIGLHTLAAAKALQGRGKIIAFEPFEPTKRLLEKSLWMNGFAQMTDIYQAAVANVTGQQSLFLGTSSGHHSLYPLDTVEHSSMTPVEVPLVRLDDIVQTDQNISLLKVDVEGAELEVIESASAIIANNLGIGVIVEFGPSHLKRCGHTIQQWFDTFTHLGLSYRVINAMTGLLEDWSIAQLEQAYSVNLFFAHKNSPAWIKATS